MKYTFILFYSILTFGLVAQDTFSLCAVDSTTGEVGSVGASCLDNIQFPGSNGAILISDVKPGVGVIHTQSYWLVQNQNNARDRMDEGKNAGEIIDWLANNDVQNNPTIRQYGAAILDMDGRPSAKAFTGNNCLDYKGQIEGLSYSIQGNILLGQQILDSMQARFLREKGDLASRLMAALQGANVAGADKRCLNEGVSSLSAFLRVAKPDDDEDNLFLDLNVPSTPFGVEPIDSLQTLYDNWRKTLSLDQWMDLDFSVSPNPSMNTVTVVINDLVTWNEADILCVDVYGKVILKQGINESKSKLDVSKLVKGTYSIFIMTDSMTRSQAIKLIKI